MFVFASFSVLMFGCLRDSRALTWLRWSCAGLLSLLLVLDLVCPLPLPASQDMAMLVVARDGTPLRAFPDAGGVWRYPALLAQVSPLYVQALLTYEDRMFWHHPGINPWALLRAGGHWLRYGRIVSGGSTLTMQVARILEPHGRTPWGKLRQLLRAVQLEVHLSKSQILQLYLERAPYGGTIQGVEAASWAYLGKSAARLSHAEAALLAVLPQSPSRFRPDRNPEAALYARDKVLTRMAVLGVWSDEDVKDARLEPVVARALQPPMYAALLAQRLRAQSPRVARIVTTLDIDLQRTLEERVSTYFSPLPERTSAAVLVMDNQSLEARAYVGSVAFGDAKRLGQVDMVQAWRSPGSTLKPFLYGMALDQGLIHSESLLVDAPQRFGDYRPGNFDAVFNGPIGAASALRQSLNVPAVDLLERIGPARLVARLAHAGVQLRFSRGTTPNLALILGGTGTQLQELVGAFSAFNRGGVAGRVRYTPNDPRIERRLISPGAAWIVREILAANPRPGYGRGTFDTAMRPSVAWKTGTSYGFRDAWALGGTRRYTVGVWVGRPDGTPLPGQYGAITALPLMFDVIDALPREPGNAVPEPMPASVEQVDICWPLGLAAVNTAPELCRRRYSAYALDGVVPPTLAERDARLWRSGLERFQVDARSGLRVMPNCRVSHVVRERQIARWPALVTPWLDAAERDAAQLPPLAPDCSDDGRGDAGVLYIDGLVEGATLARAPGSAQPVRLQLRALGSEARIDWLLNGRWIAQTVGRRTFQRDFLDPGTYVLTALAEDGAWSRVQFRVVR
ncbi:penicillin-binding protein 1C [Xylella taiwanensis]|uniref:peptidoglycan glycosyltransferase n=1 Tax=Xylella taiwanensis TaxID=1444770 RepID=Z9JIH6_9GAMM|nr:penicillin-binding protein 1C [Xylella taiwanensis]AXI83758.1 penicillin-binding protein [Xylella taiwanensis]EWS78210.1 penicillin-binding protein 1C [Xylella taiwanensis]MCD8456860.1 penicillin-binding protein 1C [Xylella taiwanensis]MCD8459269.1 penicillin-binding protein 1C [Xylella taiwanensis]MCD8461858.1 penicillin-binding protein 1C [Xylella taiwanensis]